ncbi:BTB-kelch protein [Parasponia andersonii]|uniref:BTB-kelch protein n=1 Tax=Parasponia andersonii TaxID=3476 RepID=A0A2P5CCM0_PARAD|nr:BTB-kelch protein [Parasponia andersonii]
MRFSQAISQRLGGLVSVCSLLAQSLEPNTGFALISPVYHHRTTIGGEDGSDGLGHCGEDRVAVFRPIAHAAWNSLLRFARVFPLPVVLYSVTAVVGHIIYVLGGFTDLSRTSSAVWVLDCRSRTWERGPSMRAPRSVSSVAVVGGEIYAIGVHGDELRIEVLDAVTERWEAVTSPVEGKDALVKMSRIDEMDGRIRVRVGLKAFWLDPTNKTWEVAGDVDMLDLCYSGQCVVGGTSFWCDHRIDGSASSTGGVKMRVWCAEVEVIRKNGELSGGVLWSEKVLLLPEEMEMSHSKFFFHCACLSVSL